EAAFDALVRHRQARSEAVTQFIEQHGFDGVWTAALHRRRDFLSLLPAGPGAVTDHGPQPAVRARDSLQDYAWNRATLVESGLLCTAVEILRDQGRAEHQYLPTSRILDSAREAVAVRDRVAHLSA